MPEEDNIHDCNQVFGARLNYLEKKVDELSTYLRKLEEREASNSAKQDTRISIAENNIKWWSSVGGLAGGFVVELARNLIIGK